MSGIAWVWDPEKRCFVLPRRFRLPKRQRRLARARLRDEPTPEPKEGT